jgi:hypothetical protein
LFFPDEAPGIFRKVIPAVGMGPAAASAAYGLVLALSAKALQLFFTMAQILK